MKRALEPQGSSSGGGGQASDRTSTATRSIFSGLSAVIIWGSDQVSQQGTSWSPPVTTTTTTTPTPITTTTTFTNNPSLFPLQLGEKRSQILTERIRAKGGKATSMSISKLLSARSGGSSTPSKSPLSSFLSPLAGGSKKSKDKVSR